jgi:hypothetical protein
VGYCSLLSPDGFYCILKTGHQGPHLSIDNRFLWQGTPGKPVQWGAEYRADPPPDDTKRRREKAVSLGYTGEFCSNCGSANMRRAGTCMTCESCGTTTGCS